MTDKPRKPTPTEQAAMDARPGEPDASGLPEPAIIPTHEGADAFWKYWRENGETHRHGYFESTWGAINAALRVSGVTMHIYADASGDPINPHVVSATPEPQPDFEAMQATINKQQLARRYEHVAPKRLYAEAKRAEERGNHSEAYFMRQAADALDEQAAEIAAYERLDEEGYASLAVDLAAAEQRIADLEYANSDTAGEQQLRIFAKQNAALREALARLTNAVSLGRIGPKPSKIGGVPRYEFSKRQNDILEIAFAKARAALEAGDE